MCGHLQHQINNNLFSKLFFFLFHKKCSVPCGVGQRSREVVCVSNQGDVEKDEECNKNLKPDTLQNCDMGACARSWFTSLWSQGVTQKLFIQNLKKQVYI